MLARSISSFFVPPLNIVLRALLARDADAARRGDDLFVISLEGQQQARVSAVPDARVPASNQSPKLRIKPGDRRNDHEADR